jgi:hypothetical protein
VQNATLSRDAREIVINARDEILDEIKLEQGYLLANVSTFAKSNELVNAAAATLKQQVAFFTTKIPIADFTHEMWDLQGLRITDLRSQQSPKANLTAIYQSALRFSAAADKAGDTEQRERSLAEYAVHNTRVAALSPGDSIAALGGLEQAAVAIVTCSVLLMVLSQAATVWLALTRAKTILRYAHDLNLNTVVRASNAKSKKEAETDELIDKASETHYKQHRRAVVFSTLLVLSASIPCGMGFWATHAAVDTARTAIGSASSSLEAFQAAVRLRDNETILNRLAVAELTGGAEGLAVWSDFYETHLLSHMRLLVKQVRRPFDLDPTLRGDSNARLDETELLIDQLKAILVKIDDGARRELFIFDSVSLGFGADYSQIFRQISENARAALLQVPEEPLLGALAPFSTSPGNILGDYFTQFMEGQLRIARGATTLQQKFAAAEQLVDGVANYIRYTDAVLVEQRIFYLMITGAQQDNSFERRYTDFTFLQNLFNLVENATITDKMQQRFGTVLGNFSTEGKTAEFFASAPAATNYLSTDLGDRMTLVAEGSRSSARNFGMAEYQRLFVFNRGLVASAFQSEGRTSLSEWLRELARVVELLMKAPGMVAVKTNTNLASKTSLLEATVDVSPRGLNRLATVRSAVQWSFIVAFWVVSAGLVFVSREMRLL